VKIASETKTSRFCNIPQKFLFLCVMTDLFTVSVESIWGSRQRVYIFRKMLKYDQNLRKPPRRTVMNVRAALCFWLILCPGCMHAGFFREYTMRFTIFISSSLVILEWESSIAVTWLYNIKCKISASLKVRSTIYHIMSLWVESCRQGLWQCKLIKWRRRYT
jgi:hypothetical protein